MVNRNIGTVIANLGNKITVYSDEYGYQQCFYRKALPAMVAGDMVYWQPGNDGFSHLIVEVLPRSSQVARMNKFGKLKIMAANVTKAIIVCAYLPEFKCELLDRYLVNCQYLDITPVIVFNKLDLVPAAELARITQTIEFYEQIGIRCFMLSAIKSSSISELANYLQGQTVVFMGQSGVGKSSLVNLLFPDASAKIGEISKSAKGKHTTVAATLYFNNDNTRVIDSPGIRDLSLEHLSVKDVANGFVEFKQYIAKCKYNDCTHLKEYSCALRDAVESQTITRQRYNSYKNIIKGKS